MINKLKKILEKQHYSIVGEHSAIQVCRWTKKSLLDEGACYKQKFYGIESHRCCQMSPSINFCENSCLHCWRALEYNLGMKISKRIADKPEKIIDSCILSQRKMISGFKGNKKINMKKWEEAQEPNQFAISLSGEPTIYPHLAELIKELRKRKISSFLVTNGLNPEVLKKLKKENALPTQLYISLNSPNEKMYKWWHRSKEKNAWKKFNRSLEIMRNLKTRRVLRMTLVKEKNMREQDVGGYAKLIKKAMPDWIEVKGYMSVGFARKRLGYETMPNHEEINKFAKKMEEELQKENYKILDEKKESRVVLLGKDRRNLKIKESEI